MTLIRRKAGALGHALTGPTQALGHQAPATLRSLAWKVAGKRINFRNFFATQGLPLSARMPTKFEGTFRGRMSGSAEKAMPGDLRRQRRRRREHTFLYSPIVRLRPGTSSHRIRWCRLEGRAAWQSTLRTIAPTTVGLRTQESSAIARVDSCHQVFRTSPSRQPWFCAHAPILA